MMKVSLVLLLGLSAAALLRRRSAAVRHWVLAATIVCAAATPLLELVVPAWRLPLSSWRLGRSVEPLTLLIPVHLAPSFDTPEGVRTASANLVEQLTVPQVLGSIWLAGAAISLSILMVGLARLAWLAAKSQRVDHGTWADLTDGLSREYGLRRPVLLLRSSHPTLLVTWGLRQPKVILPQEARDWPEDRVRIVLGHELAHIVRRDWLVQMVAELLRSAYWFNPIVWIACRRLRLESEHACDDAVLSLGIKGPEYATHLLAVARAFKGYRATVFPAPAMARPSSLERRVSAMLNNRLNRRPITRSAGIAIATALLGLTLPIAGLVAAQAAAATFSGTLVDAVGRILPDVSLVLANVESKQKYEVQSDQAGHFALTGLPPGDYQVEARLPGFATSQGRVALGSGQTLNRDVALQIGAIEETLMVSSKDTPTPVRPARQALGPPEVDSCRESTVGGCIKPPRRIAHAQPRYPQAHVASGTAGKVEVDGRIGTDGFLKDLRVIAPADPDFASATVEALRHWQFTATRLDGVPVETDFHVHVRFSAE